MCICFYTRVYAPPWVAKHTHVHVTYLFAALDKLHTGCTFEKVIVRVF